MREGNVAPVALLAALLLLSPAEGVRAHAGHDHGEPAAPLANDPSRLPDGGVFLPKPAQRLYGIRTEPARNGVAARAYRLEALTTPDPNGSGQVQAPERGRIVAPEGGLPGIGQRVRAEQIVAWLEPLPDSLDRAEHEAALAELARRIAFAEQELRRLEQLRESATPRQIEQARAEWQALEARQKALQLALREPRPLRAPLAGTIADSRLVLGQVAAAGDRLLEIVDPSRMQIEALAFDHTLASRVARATARTDQGTALKLEYLGAGPRLHGQAVPLRFALLEAPPVPLVVRQPVEVLVETADTVEGMVLPRGAVARGAGSLTQVWLHVGAERFAPRLVEVEPLDAARVVIRGGLTEGDRVVVQGAALLNQVR